MDFLNASTIQSDFYLKCHINHCGNFSWSKLSVKWWYPSLMVSSLIIEVLLIEVSHQGNKWWISPEGGVFKLLTVECNRWSSLTWMSSKFFLPIYHDYDYWSKVECNQCDGVPWQPNLNVIEIPNSSLIKIKVVANHHISYNCWDSLERNEGSLKPI